MLKLYKPRNVISTAFHYGATVAVAAGSYALAPAWAIITGAAVVLGYSRLILKWQKELLENDIVKHPDMHKFSPNLGKIVKDLYKESGLSSEDYPVYDFSVDSKKVKKGSFKEGFSRTFKTQAQSYSAAAANISKPVIMISEPLLKLLDDEEEKAVLAHEFTHAAARHTHMSFPQILLGATASAANSFAVIGTMLTSGWLAITAAIAQRIGISFALRKWHPMGSLLEKDKNDLSLREIVDAKKIKRLFDTTAKAISIGIFTYANPLFLKVLIPARALSTTAEILNSTYSRSCEYQADRGVVELGANPLALITALRKITSVMKESKAIAFDGKVPERSWLGKQWEKVTSSHPTTERRIERLAQVARECGYSNVEIKYAMRGTLNIPKNSNIPYGVIKKLAAQI